MVLPFVTDDKWLEITKIYFDVGLDKQNYGMCIQ